MLHALLHNKLKDSFQDPHFKPSEDSLTSSVIGLMQYLPDYLFWQLLRDSCGKLSKLPKDVGKILAVNFWERMLPDGMCNSSFVEPDVWIECDMYHIIIEAKKYDSCGQEEEQWRKEIVSFNKTFDDNNKELVFIALGGNVSLQDCYITVDGKQYIVHTSSWYNLLCEVSNYLHSLQTNNFKDGKQEYIRLLNDLVSIFAKHGHLKIQWLESISMININKNSKKTIYDLLDFDNKVILQDFCKPIKQITYNNILDIWKTR